MCRYTIRIFQFFSTPLPSVFSCYMIFRSHTCWHTSSYLHIHTCRYTIRIFQFLVLLFHQYSHIIWFFAHIRVDIPSIPLPLYHKESRHFLSKWEATQAFVKPLAWLAAREYANQQRNILSLSNRLIRIASGDRLMIVYYYWSKWLPILGYALTIVD